jgi:hypothetical protein
MLTSDRHAFSNAKARGKTPLETNLLCLGNNEIYCISNTRYVISVFNFPQNASQFIVLFLPVQIILMFFNKPCAKIT